MWKTESRNPAWKNLMTDLERGDWPYDWTLAAGPERHICTDTVKVVI